jgi:hypothetical protein
MSFQTRPLIAGAALALLSTSAAWAQSTAPAMGSEPGMANKPAATASADKPMAEKVLTTKEMQAAFTKADVSKDGKLDKVEAEAVPGLVARFEQIDGDGDKLVSKAEFNKAIKQ